MASHNAIVRLSLSGCLSLNLSMHMTFYLYLSSTSKLRTDARTHIHAGTHIRAITHARNNTCTQARDRAHKHKPYYYVIFTTAIPVQPTARILPFKQWTYSSANCHIYLSATLYGVTSRITALKGQALG